MRVSLETGINMTGASTLRCVAGNIDKSTFPLTFRAEVRRFRSGYSETAMGKFPVGQSAFEIDISLKPTVGCITAVGTYPFLMFVFHVSTLL